ncbi:CATRA conflict system CASPASE/TPR repeat-associated protein [Pseudonocardia charpentierae]|uniref:BN6_48550 family protein n=1 Tax=Pseudonocardia charpentierae TaxID=3075545 RepID=A0ABU2NJM2_9PSEU|nr:CATRA conflict system CASPASE/TPR repeat-associated protein [Pseudonocardia sp. DSM 45834]MDT0353623.1 BN6_48550 family protein [Pseudonocardia sp. DSM 45834]
MPRHASLQGEELVAHVFVAASAPSWEVDRTWVLDLWHRCSDRFGLDAVAGHDRKPPDELTATAAPGGLLALRGGTGSGVHQVALRRLRDVVVLSVVRSPGAGQPEGWSELEAEWDAVLRPPTPGVVGEVRILQARLADPAARLDPAALGPVVEAAAGTPGEWARTGVLRDAVPLGPFAVWEVPDPAQTAWDTRAARRLIVVAPADGDDQLSAWTWSRGTPELTPLASYLLHAAKLRYELRVRAAAMVRDLRVSVDAEIGPLLRLTDEVATGRDPDVRALSAASARLVKLQAGDLGLANRSSRLREMRRTVEIAARNMAAYRGPEQPTGLIDDDAGLADWAARQLDNDVTYLEAALDRTRSVVALADQLVQRGLQDRRERFNLGLTGVVGAVLMVLAAMQSLKLEFTLPKPLLAGVVSGLGALALLVPALLVRLAAPDRRSSRAFVSVAVALLAGTLPWIVLSVRANAAGTAVATVPIVGWGVVVAAVAAGVTWLVLRPWSATAACSAEAG